MTKMLTNIHFICLLFILRSCCTVFGLVFIFSMNVFLMRSGEMFRFAAILGRFARLNRTAVQIHNSTTPCLVRTGRTLQVAAFHSVRYFCRQGTRTLSYDERTESLTLSLRVPDPAVSEMEQRSTFYQELQECGSPSDVLDLVDRCGVEHRCISNSLTRMWHTTKKMSEEQRRWELRLMAEHPAFEKLCHSARTNAPRMHCHSLAFTLLGLVKLGVSQSSLVVQTLLRVIQVCSFTLLALGFDLATSSQSIKPPRRSLHVPLSCGCTLLNKTLEPPQTLNHR